MKKIISLVGFIIALMWTWNLVHGTAPIGFETHSSIQEKFSELIKNTIQAKKPEATDVKIVRLWTENAGERKVRALFSYQFSEASSAQNAESSVRTIEGEAFLYRELSDDPTIDKWVLQSLVTKGDAVAYSEGSVITPDNESSDEKDPSAP